MAENERLKEEVDALRLSGGAGQGGGEELAAAKSKISELEALVEETNSALVDANEEKDQAVEQGKAYKQKLLGMMEARQQDLIQRIMSFVFFQMNDYFEEE